MFIINQNVLTSLPLPTHSSLITSSLREIYLLKEILLAEQLTVAGEALVIQLSVALTALQALCMPGPLQHLQYETIQDEFVAAAALGYCSCKCIQDTLRTLIHANNIPDFIISSFY